MLKRRTERHFFFRQDARVFLVCCRGVAFRSQGLGYSAALKRMTWFVVRKSSSLSWWILVCSNNRVRLVHKAKTAVNNSVIKL